jgi:hypothetical protein
MISPGIHLVVLFWCRVFLPADMGGVSVLQEDPAAKSSCEGYHAVIGCGEGFLAAGSGGKIDRFSVAGKLTGSEEFPGEVFNGLLLHDRHILAAGEHGSMLVFSEQGGWRKVESGTRENIRSLTRFRGMVIAGADGGQLVLGDMNQAFKMIPLPVKGNIVSVSAGASACFGVTDAGEILRSGDGIHWDVLDFNRMYSGYYGSCRFTRVLATDARVAVAGVRQDGSPVLFFSHLGGVWTERPLSYKDDQGHTASLTGTPNDILFDAPGDRFFLVCSGGKMMMLPSCTQCNELTDLSPYDLQGIAGSGNTLAIAGENFLMKTIHK